MNATPVARPMVRREACPSIALVLVCATVAACGVGLGGATASPASSATPVPSLSGTPGHYDDGEMSFDYPSDWPVLAAQVPESCGVIYVLVVLGRGSWSEGANQTQSNGAVLRGIDSVTVPPGGIVVRVYWRGGGPAPVCEGYNQANATIGPNAVRKTTAGSVTSWEIRLPGGEFLMPNNPVLEVHTSDPAQLAKVEAMVASFRWEPSAPSYEGLCSQPPVGSPAG